MISSRKMMPREMLESGTKQVTYEALIGPMRFINFINITQAKEVLIIPNSAKYNQDVEDIVLRDEV